MLKLLVKSKWGYWRHKGEKQVNNIKIGGYDEHKKIAC